MFVIGTVNPFGSSLKLILAGPELQRLFTSSVQGKDVQVFPLPSPGESVCRENIFCPLKYSVLVRCQKNSPNDVPCGFNVSTGEGLWS